MTGRLFCYPANRIYMLPQIFIAAECLIFLPPETLFGLKISNSRTEAPVTGICLSYFGMTSGVYVISSLSTSQNRMNVSAVRSGCYHDPRISTYYHFPAGEAFSGGNFSFDKETYIFSWGMSARGSIFAFLLQKRWRRISKKNT